MIVVCLILSEKANLSGSSDIKVIYVTGGMNKVCIP